MAYGQPLLTFRNPDGIVVNLPGPRLRSGRSSLEMVHRTISLAYGQPLLTFRNPDGIAKKPTRTLGLTKLLLRPQYR